MRWPVCCRSVRMIPSRKPWLSWRGHRCQRSLRCPVPIYTYNWMIEPYARYRFLELNKFGVWSECNAYFGRKTGNTKVGSTKSDANPVCSWGINVLPVLTYTINDHLCLETSLNAFGFGYKGTYTKNSDKSYEANTSAVSFAANSTDIFGQLGLVNIGFTYKF